MGHGGGWELEVSLVSRGLVTIVGTVGPGVTWPGVGDQVTLGLETVVMTSSLHQHPALCGLSRGRLEWLGGGQVNNFT